MAAAEPGEVPVKKRSDLPVRVASAAVMVAVAGLAFWLRGWVLEGFIAALGLGIFVEWTMLTFAFERRWALRALWLAAGMGYIGLAIETALLLVHGNSPVPWLVIPVALVVAVDVGAYFAGRTFGGPKIAPKISPSKTWSGLGGAIFAATALFLALYRLGFGYGGVGWGDGRVFPIAIAWGVVVAVVAQTGDFFESWMKRRAGVKDSGRLIPGHGGLFDRADGLIAVLFVIGVIIDMVR